MVVTRPQVSSRWQAHEWVAAAGTRMHAALLGRSDGTAGRDVVLVPGLGCSHRYFRRLAEELAPHARVAAVDLPGFGLTPPRGQGPAVLALSSALDEWLHRTGRDGSVLVGHSAGCHVVADLALHAPETVGPVALVAPAVDGRRRPWQQHVVRLAEDILLDGPRSWRTWSMVALDVLASGPVRDVRQFRLLLEDPLTLTARRLPCPTVVIRGAGDPVSPPDLARDVAEAAAGGRLVEVPGARHLVHWTHAPHVAREIVPLLRE